MTSPARLRSRPLLTATVIAGILLLPVITLSGWALGVRAVGNVHEVEKRQLYRSAQLSDSQLNEVIDQYKIRTIINLRGRNPGLKWYDDEIGVASRMGITHIDVAMSASKEPDAATVDRLTAAFQIAPKPILVHCEGGADRSGLASAIYELRIAHRPLSQATSQLSLLYGHFPWLMSKTVAMDNALAHIAAARALR
jgi:protein tyrosine/serine phosphatase